MEAEIAQHKRKLRMETVPWVKEAVFLARALRKWNTDMNVTVQCVEDAAAFLDKQAEEPQ
jgi:hypothetical protein